MLSFEEARACVVREITKHRAHPRTESVALDAATGRVLADAALADRDYPALNRSVRDGFAVRSSDLPGQLNIIGESRAGGSLPANPGPGEAVEIMTGAPVPTGADCVVMVEHVMVEHVMVEHGGRNGNLVIIDKAALAGQFISFRGEEATLGQQLLPAGKMISYSDIAVLAATGHACLNVFAKPRVAILPTGDELVAVAATPKDFQVRNSNSHSLASQVVRSGATPYILPPARDNEEDTRSAIERALASSDLLLLSGGVSAGKYDIVERVLSSLGAEFFFDRVAIQPGQPLVFGRVQGKFFFGLPGNPGSTMVTFEVFARAAVELIAGQSELDAHWALGRLTQPFRHKPGLTRFLPALLTGRGDLTPLPWKGSSDIPAIARANVFLVANETQSDWQAGDTLPVIRK
jgi:molybdopterin molybdotransferase